MLLEKSSTGRPFQSFGASELLEISVQSIVIGSYREKYMPVGGNGQHSKEHLRLP